MPADHEQLQRSITRISLIAAPTLLLVSEILRAVTIQSPRSQVVFASQVLALAALAFFAPAVLGLARLLRAWSPAATASALALVLLGIMGSTGAVALRVVMWGLERTLAPDVFTGVRRAIPFQVLLTLLVPSLLFSLGLVALAVGLYRTRVVPRRVSLLFLSGAIAFPIGSVPDVTSIILPACLAMLAAWVRIAMSRNS